MLFRNVRNRRAYRRASSNGRVCCTFAPNGRPIYFNVAPDASDQDIDRAAFRARHGRLMTPGEETLYALARSRGEALKDSVEC